MNKLANKPILFLGDNHGSWNDLLFDIKWKNITDVNIISVGDLGVGFNPYKDVSTYERLNEEFKQKHINFYGIRGNHDDPAYFTGEKRIKLSHFELLEDYSLYKHENKLIQFVGGAISIDRTGRAVGVSYWENERVVYNKEACSKVDVLVTHTAPSHCFPQTFNEIVYGWAREDAYLIEDLTDERAIMDEIFKLCSPSLHLYGHFHSSWTEVINECKHKLLDINELWEMI